MVRQEDVDNLFAKPGTARRHCMMVTACIVFDVTIYPLIIWFLFIDVPEFLQSSNDEDAERLTLFIKLVAMCGFTFIVCMYQVILFDLFGQHCNRMREAVLSTSKTPRDAHAGMTDEWTDRQEAPVQAESREDLELPGAVRHAMPPIEETPEVTPVQALPASGQRAPSRSNPGLAQGDDRARAPAFVRRHRSDEAVGARASVSASTDGATEQQAGKQPEKIAQLDREKKTVSFDRETVFTYIKQTPVQTPR